MTRKLRNGHREIQWPLVHDIPEGHPRIYWAYGSNLNVIQMQHRCPTSFPLATMTMPDYRLLFDRVLSVEPKKGCSVPGALYSVELEDIAHLDIYEGFPSLYQKVFFDVNIDGEIKPAFFYVMGGAQDSAPSVDYVDCCLEGYDEWGLDEDVLFKAWQEAEDADEQWYSDFSAAKSVEAEKWAWGLDDDLDEWADAAWEVYRRQLDGSLYDVDPNGQLFELGDDLDDDLDWDPDWREHRPMDLNWL